MATEKKSQLFSPSLLRSLTAARKTTRKRRGEGRKRTKERERKKKRKKRERKKERGGRIISQERGNLRAAAARGKKRKALLGTDNETAAFFLNLH